MSCNHNCRQGRDCTCGKAGIPQGFTQFERLVVWIIIAMSLYFIVAGVIRLLLGK